MPWRLENHKEELLLEVWEYELDRLRRIVAKHFKKRLKDLSLRAPNTLEVTFLDGDRNFLCKAKWVMVNDSQDAN